MLLILSKEQQLKKRLFIGNFRKIVINKLKIDGFQTLEKIHEINENVSNNNLIRNIQLGFR